MGARDGRVTGFVESGDGAENVLSSGEKGAPVRENSREPDGS